MLFNGVSCSEFGYKFYMPVHPSVWFCLSFCLSVRLFVCLSAYQIHKSHPSGFTEVDLLMAAMILAVEEHQLAIEQDAAEEQQRIARENVIMEQDRAYQESLAQDKQKVCK